MTANFESLIIGYFDGSLSKAEKAELFNLLAVNTDAKKIFLDYKLIWDTAYLKQDDNPIDIDLEFEKISLNFHSDNSNNKPGILKPILITVLKYAAILIVGFFISYYIISTYQKKQESSEQVTYNELIVPKGQRSQLVLADGTKIWLNSDTRLRYPTKFTLESRNVFLEGEAYFEVTKSDHIPFIVNAGALEIKVMGTIFNVRNYPDDENIETTLIEGKVSLIQKQASLKDKEIIMAPNQQALLQRANNSLTIKNIYDKVVEERAVTNEKTKTLSEPINSIPVISWKEEVLLINNESLKEIQIKLERWYGYSVHVKDSSLYTQRYKGKFNHHETIFQVLDAIRLTTPMKYTVSGKDITIEKRI